MNYKNVVMVSTGGTIASKRNPKTGLLTAGLLTGEELSEKCQLPTHINLDVISIFQLPSNSITFNKLETLKKNIEELFYDKELTGIVITHGTDTLEETAYFLDLTIKDDRPIIVTGSQRGPNVLGTDAFVNLRQAILLAASKKSHEMGVLTLFNERIFGSRYLKKAHSYNIDGFYASGYGCLGTIDQDEVTFYQRPVHRSHFELKEKLSDIEIIKTSLGSKGNFIKYAADLGYKGLIIEAAGRGHVPPAIMENVRYAIKKNVSVILTTSAGEGKVKVIYDFPGSAFDLKNIGVILGNDYDSKKARIKLAVLIAAHERNLQKHFDD